MMSFKDTVLYDREMPIIDVLFGPYRLNLKVPGIRAFLKNPIKSAREFVASYKVAHEDKVNSKLEALWYARCRYAANQAYKAFIPAFGLNVDRPQNTMNLQQFSQIFLAWEEQLIAKAYQLSTSPMTSEKEAAKELYTAGRPFWIAAAVDKKAREFVRRTCDALPAQVETLALEHAGLGKNHASENKIYNRTMYVFLRSSRIFKKPVTATVSPKSKKMAPVRKTPTVRSTIAKLQASKQAFYGDNTPSIAAKKSVSNRRNSPHKEPSRNSVPPRNSVPRILNK